MNNPTSKEKTKQEKKDAKKQQNPPTQNLQEKPKEKKNTKNKPEVTEDSVKTEDKPQKNEKKDQGKEKQKESGQAKKEKKAKDKEKEKEKEKEKDTQMENASQENANANAPPLSKVKNGPKKRIYALTTFDEHNAEMKKKRDPKVDQESDFSLMPTVKKKTENRKKEITSKHIVKMLMKDNFTAINEEVVITLLKVSKAGMSKQAKICTELIGAIKCLIEDINDDNGKMISEIRDKVGKVISIVYKLTHVNGGLDNTCSYIKKVLSQIPITSNPSLIKVALLNKLEEFINTKINTKAIITLKAGVHLIKENDCVLIYGKSKIFRDILSNAVKEGINYRVIFADNLQENHMKSEVEFLSKLGVSVTYSYLNGISGIIDKVTKVFIKAKSMLSNGNLLGEVGTSLLSCIANNFKKPVIAFSQTYKFWDKIMMNSYQPNNSKCENLPFPESCSPSSDAKYPHMDLYYDITPANYINMVVCELGYIPPTSVPVVIREFGQEDIEFEI